jgi:hypothetical protein
LTWAVAGPVAAGPFVGYLLSRTVELPADADDKGNWADAVGTLSLFVEGSLIVLAVSVVASGLRTARVSASRPLPVPDTDHRRLRDAVAVPTSIARDSSAP